MINIRCVAPVWRLLCSEAGFITGATGFSAVWSRRELVTVSRESQQKPRMGAKASTETGVRTYSNVGQGSSAAMESSGGQHAMVDVGGAAGHRGARARPRTRSLGTAVHRGHPLVFTGGSPDSDDSTPEDRPRSRSLVGAALPFHLFSFHGIKCPVCSKFIQADDVECHLVMCLTKPRVSYNDDVLQEDKGGECVICFEDLLQGDTIARLPCLCIYHKTCIDQWFKINRSCPEHPSD